MTNLNDMPDGLEIPTRLLDAPREVREEVRDSIWPLIVRGISAPEEYQGIVADADGPDLSEQQERAIVEYLLAARRAQQATFTDLPEPRLDRAFAALRAARIVAEQDFTCCGTCGAAEIGTDQADELDQWLGYVFFHSQDTDTLVESGTVYLNYGIFWPAHLTQEQFEAKSRQELDELYAELSVALMNDVVIPILKDHGIGVQWNGKMDTRILLTDVDWYRPIDQAS